MLEPALQCLNCLRQPPICDYANALFEVVVINGEAADDIGGHIGQESERLNEIAVSMRGSVTQALIAAGIEPTDSVVETIENATFTPQIAMLAAKLDKFGVFVVESRQNESESNKKALAIARTLRRCAGPIPYGKPDSFGRRRLLCRLPADILDN